jgi:hypothetical protein
MCTVKSAAAVSGFNVPSLATCLKRKIEQNTDGKARAGLGVAPARESWPQQGQLHALLAARQNHLTETIGLFCQNVSSICSDETILPGDETIFRFQADIRKQPLVISYPRSEHTAST